MPDHAFGVMVIGLSAVIAVLVAKMRFQHLLLKETTMQQASVAVLANHAPSLTLHVRADLTVLDVYGRLEALVSPAQGDSLTTWLTLAQSQSHNKTHTKTHTKTQAIESDTSDRHANLQANTQAAERLNALVQRVCLSEAASELDSEIAREINHTQEKSVTPQIEQIEIASSRETPSCVIEVRATQQPDDQVSLILTLMNITQAHNERLRLNNALQRAESVSGAKGRFLASVSHEIRTPLNAMQGMLTLLADSSLNPRQRSQLNTLQQSADHMLAIVNDVLDLSKIESGRLTLHQERIDLHALAQRVVGMVQARAAEKRLPLQVFIEDTLPVWGQGDPLRITQILINLLNNAIKFTEHGHVTLSLSASARGVCFKVEDTGIGIPESMAQCLFEEYQCGDEDDLRRMGGTGLGLNICRRLTRAMGGQIGVTSQTGQGSVFWVELPLVLADAEEAVNEAADKALDGSGVTGNGLNIDADKPGKRVAQHSSDDSPGRGHALWVADSYAVNRTWVISLAERLGLETRSFDRLRDLNRALESGVPALLVMSRRFFDAPDMVDNRTRLLERADVTVLVSCDESNADGWQAPPEVGYSWAWPVDHRALTETLRRLLMIQQSRAAVSTLPLTQVRQDGSHLSDAPESATGHQAGHQATTSGISTCESNDTERTPNVMLVEDNPVNRKVLQKLLESYGCHVTALDDGAAVMGALEVQYPDLIIMDRYMPILDGITVTRQLHAHPSYSNIPVIALSGETDPRQQAIFIEAGAQDYLLKPVRPEELKALVQRLKAGHFRKE
ncbi:MAG: hypothetical protein CMK92_03960 [Pseudomonas sp.]|nr:hypothetical protein [Pseudomonas sp.]